MSNVRWVKWGWKRSREGDAEVDGASFIPTQVVGIGIVFGHIAEVDERQDAISDSRTPAKTKNRLQDESR